MTLDKLIMYMSSAVKKRAELLQETWVKECCDIVGQNRDTIESIMPEDEVGFIFYLRKMLQHFARA